MEEANHDTDPLIPSTEAQNTLNRSQDEAASKLDSNLIDISTSLSEYQFLMYKTAISTQGITLSELDNYSSTDEFPVLFRRLKQRISLEQAAFLTVYVLRRLKVDEAAINPLSNLFSSGSHLTAKYMSSVDYILSLWEVLSNMWEESPDHVHYKRFITSVRQNGLLANYNEHHLRKPAFLIDKLNRRNLLSHANLPVFFQCVVDAGRRLDLLEPLKEFCSRNTLEQPEVKPLTSYAEVEQDGSPALISASNTDEDHDDDHTASNTKKGFFCRNWKMLVVVIAGFILFSAIIALANYVFDMRNELNTLKEGLNASSVPVDVGNLPREIGDSFDSSRIGKVKLYIPNYTKDTNMTSYYGECSKVSNQTTPLPPFIVKLANVTANNPVPVSYSSHQLPIFTLPDSNFTYNVSLNASTENSTEVGCAYIYLFNTSKSYQAFLRTKDKAKETFLNESECIVVKQESPPSPISHIINITSETFIFGAVKANVSFNAVITISGFRREYDVSQLENQGINSSVTTIDLCTSFDCNYLGTGGKHYCVFVNSTNYTRINYTEDNVPLPIHKHVVLEDVIVVGVAGSVALLAAIGILVVTSCACCQYCCKCMKKKRAAKRIIANNELTKGSPSTSNHSKDLFKDDDASRPCMSSQ